MLYFFVLIENNEFYNQIWYFSKQDFNEKIALPTNLQ